MKRHFRVSFFFNLKKEIMTHNLLKGKRGIIFGALNESSIAWKIAEKAFEEGAQFTLTNTAISVRMGEINKLAEKCNSKVIISDATNVQELESLITQSVEFLGGKLDFILHSVAMSFNVRKGKAYDDANYDFMLKSIDSSALSFHKLLQTAKKLDAINEWGSVVALSYLGANKLVAGYHEMAEAKSMLESIARSFGYIYGKEKKVRINTISQSPTKTAATSIVQDFDKLYNHTDQISPLGNATAEDCANTCIFLFSDMSKRITMQNIYNDGGYSSVGVANL
jgi:enoyl-[acyl-carrier protein] reductase I